MRRFPYNTHLKHIFILIDPADIVNEEILYIDLLEDQGLLFTPMEDMSLSSSTRASFSVSDVSDEELQ